MINLDNMKTFGVEVEFVSRLDRREIGDLIYEATGTYIEMASYSNKDHTKWRLKTDSSVSARGMYAMELVTPILKGEADMQKLRDVMTVIGDYGTVNITCGLHVHVGIDDLDANQYRKLLKLWLKYENACDMLLPESRRSRNQYCRSNLGSVSDEMYGYTLMQSFKTLNGAKSVRGLAGSCRGHTFGQKYTKLNTAHYWSQGTVEFRSHSGTTNKDKVDHWVRLTQAFVAVAENCRGTNINESADNKTYSTKMMLRDFYKKGYISKETVKFYKARYKELNNEICR